MLGEEKRAVGCNGGEGDFDEMVFGLADDEQEHASNSGTESDSTDDDREKDFGDGAGGERSVQDKADGAGEGGRGRAVVEKAFGLEQKTQTAARARFLEGGDHRDGVGGGN